MPNTAPKEAGDVFYPQYLRKTTEPTTSAVVKGRMYTKGSGANGNRLVAITATNVADGFRRGLYQAMVDAVAPASGENRVSCAGRGSRIGVIAKDANIHPGDLVAWDYSSNKAILYVPHAGALGGSYAEAAIETQISSAAKSDNLVIGPGL